MNQHEYMRALSRLLGSLPAAEREEILCDYQEHFDAGIAGGKSEKDIAAALGDPAQVARQYLPTPPGLQWAGKWVIPAVAGLLLLLAAGVFLLFSTGISAILLGMYVVKGYWLYALFAVLLTAALAGFTLAWWIASLRLWNLTLLNGRITRFPTRVKKPLLAMGASLVCLALAVGLSFGTGLIYKETRTHSFPITEPFRYFHSDSTRNYAFIPNAGAPHVDIAVTYWRNPYFTESYDIEEAFFVGVTNDVLECVRYNLLPFDALGYYVVTPDIYVEFYVPETTQDIYLVAPEMGYGINL